MTAATAYRAAHPPTCGRNGQPFSYGSTLEHRGTCHAPARLRIPAEMYAAVRADDAGVAVRAFGPFIEEADAKAYVAAKLGGDGYVVPFELVFRKP